MKSIQAGAMMTLHLLFLASLAVANDRPEGAHYTLVRPNGGEVFRVGAPCTVVVASDNPAMYVLEQASVEISFDGGKVWFSPGFSSSKNGTVWVWTIQPTVSDDFGSSSSSVSTNCVVRVSDYFDEEDFDVSDRPFTIRTAGTGVGVSGRPTPRGRHAREHTPVLLNGAMLSPAVSSRTVAPWTPALRGVAVP